MKKIVTIIAIVLAIAVGDLALTYNNFIVNSDYFAKNDFEITQYKHPEKVWIRCFSETALLFRHIWRTRAVKDMSILVLTTVLLPTCGK